MIGAAASALVLLAQAVVSPPVPPPAPPQPETIITVPAEHRLIEGIATDGKTIWLSSVIDRRILAWRKDKAGGYRRDRIIPMPKGTARPLGLAWDARRRWLWIATDCPEIAATDSCKGSALVAIDARGRLKATLAPPAVDQEQATHFGDVSVAIDSVYVSDSRIGAVWRCTGKCRVLEPVVQTGVGRSAQGVAAYPGGVIVADYSQGLARVDANGVRTLLPRADGRPLRGVDGLVHAGGRFFGIQNSQSPGVVFSLRLSADGAQLTDLAVLAGGDTVPDPTQLVVDGKRLVVVANSQWAAHDPAKADRPAQRMTPIIAIPLP